MQYIEILGFLRVKSTEKTKPNRFNMLIEKQISLWSSVLSEFDVQ